MLGRITMLAVLGAQILAASGPAVAAPGKGLESKEMTVEPEPKPEDVSDQETAQPQPQPDAGEEGTNIPVGDPLKMAVQPPSSEPEPEPGPEPELPVSEPMPEPRPEPITLRKKTERNVSTAYTTTGASMMDREDTAIRIGLGYPEAQILVHLPWDTDLEFAIGAGFFYALNAQLPGQLLGGSVIGEGRWRFHEKEEHSVSLVLRPQLMAGGGSGGQWAVGLNVGGPGLVYDYEMKRKHHAILGVHVPFGFYWTEKGFATRIPIAVEVGGEFEVSRKVHLFITTNAGVDIWTGNRPGSVPTVASFYARGLIGVSILL